jgi:hypothetical protein
MPKFNTDKTKMLVPILVDPTNEDPNKRYKCIYVSYPSKSRNHITFRQNEIYEKYGYGNKEDFIKDVWPMARDAGYASVWRYAREHESELKEHYFN